MTRNLKHRITIFAGILLLALLSNHAMAAQPPASQRVVYVGLLLARGGLGDRSFNDSAYLGLQAAQKQFGIRFETADFSSDAVNLDTLRRFARQEYDLIMGIGFENGAYLETVAQEFPAGRFAIIDTVAKGENVASIVYREQEGDFLMGVLAAMLTKSKKVGIIGGPMYPGMQRIISGFKQGVAYQDPSVAVVVDLASTYTDPQVGKALALKQYQSGVDVIHNACGRTGLGIIEAAKETGKLTTGASGDQRYLAPGNMVGNRPKRVDTTVLTLVQEVIEGQFTAGTRSFGLKEEGLSLGPFDKQLVSDAMLKRLETLKQEILTGKIVVTVPGE